MGATVTGVHLGPDTHANRPAANAAGQPIGALYSCTTHGLIYKTDGSTWSTYATLGGTGLSDPMTTRGDIIFRNASNATARLGRGSAGQVLTSDGTDIAWGTPSSGSSRPYLDTASFPLDGTYGYDFDAANIGPFTRHNVTSGMETYQVGGGSWMQVAITSATVDQLYTQGISAGDFDFICALTAWTTPGSDSMYGLFAITSTGAGRGPIIYTSDSGAYHATLSGYQYTANSGLITKGLSEPGMTKHWYRLTRVGTTITTYLSADGYNWGRGVAATDAASFDRIAFGRVFGVGTTDYMLVDVFDRAA